MLERLKFEAQAGGSQSEIRRIDLYDWSAPDVGSDKPLCLGDRTSINDIVGLHVYGSTPPHWITQSVLAVPALVNMIAQ